MVDLLQREDKTDEVLESHRVKQFWARDTKKRQQLEQRLNSAQQELKSVRGRHITINTEENARLKKALAYLAASNREYWFSAHLSGRLEMEIGRKKREYERKVIKSSEKEMRDNHDDVEWMLRQKMRKDEYCRLVFSIYQDMRLQHGRADTIRKKVMAEKIQALDTDIERVKKNIKEYRKKKFGENKVTKDEVKFIQATFPPTENRHQEPEEDLLSPFKTSLSNIALHY